MLILNISPAECLNVFSHELLAQNGTFFYFFNNPFIVEDNRLENITLCPKRTEQQLSRLVYYLIKSVGTSNFLFILKGIENTYVFVRQH